MIAAETSIAEGDLVETAINVDINPASLVNSAKMYIGNLASLGGRFRFWLGAIEHYSFDETMDVVSLIGSLLYVPKAARKGVLDRAWDALAPGGLLVVHENIKAQSYGRDLDIMFTVEEIDALLSGYGVIERYLSTAITPVDRETAASRSVFRVIRKLANH